MFQDLSTRQFTIKVLRQHPVSIGVILNIVQARARSWPLFQRAKVKMGPKYVKLKINWSVSVTFLKIPVAASQI